MEIESVFYNMIFYTNCHQVNFKQLQSKIQDKNYNVR